MGIYKMRSYISMSIVITPLSLFIYSVVKMLLARSDVVTDEQLATSDISAGDKRSSTALHLAAGRGHCSVAVTLLSKGASVRARLAIYTHTRIIHVH